jgi:hypothetical protein
MPKVLLLATIDTDVATTSFLFFWYADFLFGDGKVRMAEIR